MVVKPSELAAQIYVIHTLGAVALGMPELVISETEAKALAQSIAKVGEHYSIALDPKTGAILGLIATAAMIYGQRGMAIYQRMAASKPKLPKGANTAPLDFSADAVAVPRAPGASHSITPGEQTGPIRFQ